MKSMKKSMRKCESCVNNFYVWKFLILLILLFGVIAPVNAARPANDIEIKNDHLLFVISAKNGTIVQGRQANTSGTIFTGSSDRYKVIDETGEYNTSIKRENAIF